MHEIPIKLTKRDIPAANQVLAAAFFDYPLLRWLYPNEKQRINMVEDFTSIALNVCYRYGEVYVSSPDFEGVAGWLPPGEAPFSFRQILLSVPLLKLVRFGMGGARRLQPFGDFIDRKHRELAPFLHWYLQILGVSPEHQGKGISRRLLSPMLERIDREGLPCFLETNVENNVHIYERFGFRLLSEDTVPGTELKSYAMLRETGHS